VTARRLKPSRRTKITILIVGEGQTSKSFLQHIKELYVVREADFAIKVENGLGGSPRSIVERAIRLRENSAYDKCYVLFDADRPLETDVTLRKRMNKKPRIEILQSTPCIEGLFLAILQHSKFSQVSASSKCCKREVKVKYSLTGKRTDSRRYSSIFTREVLNERRHSVPELDAILKAMQI